MVRVFGVCVCVLCVSVYGPSAWIKTDDDDDDDDDDMRVRPLAIIVMLFCDNI